jgi:hypothetical protein
MANKASKASRKTKDSKTSRKTKQSKTSPKKQSAPEVPLAAADQRALEKLVSKLAQDTKALRRRPALGGFRKINAIIVQDPGNPDQVSICFDIVIPRDDGTFLAWCVCTGAGGTTISSGPCPGVLV